MVERVVNLEELLEGKRIEGDVKYRICDLIRVIRSIHEDMERYGRRKDLLCRLSDIAYEIMETLGEGESVLYNVDHRRYEDMDKEENVWIWGVSIMYHLKAKPDADKCETLYFNVFPLY